MLWIGSSALLPRYASSCNSYVALYHSLGATMGFMVWIWLFSTTVLIGAELDGALTRDRPLRSRPPRSSPPADQSLD